ncbi:MAG: helix-turn-helix domain-containing protein [Shinella sp.]|uniref:helix-turn-helix domain-containing protein n=1 Tax=Shinella sp. TaxID=1870904 RepID=UPI0040373C7C
MIIRNGMLLPLIFDTRLLPREHQFEAWRSYNSDVIDASLSPNHRDAFTFEQKVWDLGALAFTSSRMPGPQRPRSWTHLSKDPLDHWCFVLPESAQYIERVMAESPQVYFRSLGRQFSGVAADSSVSTLFIPRDLLRPIGDFLDGHSGTLPNDGLGLLLSDFLISVERRLPTMMLEDVPRLVESLATMIIACVAPTPDRVAEARQPIASTRLERARQWIHVNLRSPTLNPATVCREIGVSRSTLYTLFEPLQGVSHYIQRQRLLAAYRMLRDPMNRLTVGQLAGMFCFSDASTFTRAFRQELGCLPRDVQGGGPVPTPARASTPPQTVVELGTVLRRLQP